MAAPIRIQVKVGLRQHVVEIDAYPDTTWESAKLVACVAAGDLQPPITIDPATHRLLFRGREPSPFDTIAGLGVKPTQKLMLLETESSKRERAQAEQAEQAEEMRLRRAKEFSEKQGRTSNEHVDESSLLPKQSSASSLSPLDSSIQTLNERTKGVDVLERDLEVLEQRVRDGESAASTLRGYVGQKAELDANTCDDSEFLVFADRCEKAIIQLDEVLTHGDEQLRANRKALVTRIQSLLRRGDEARAKNAVIRL